MNIKTYCKTIDMDHYDKLCFDHDRAMVSFSSEFYREELYFQNKEKAMEFHIEILEALHGKEEEVDLSHFIVAYGTLHIRSARKEIEERIKTQIIDED